MPLQCVSSSDTVREIEYRFYSYHMAWNFTEAYVFGAGFRAATLARAYFKSERGRG